MDKLKNGHCLVVSSYEGDGDYRAEKIVSGLSEPAARHILALLELYRASHILRQDRNSTNMEVARSSYIEQALADYEFLFDEVFGEGNYDLDACDPSEMVTDFVTEFLGYPNPNGCAVHRTYSGAAVFLIEKDIPNIIKDFQ